MSHPLIHAGEIDDIRLAKTIASLTRRDDVRYFLRHIAAERLRTLEALAGSNPDDGTLRTNQGRVQALAWVIELFNKTDDEE